MTNKILILAISFKLMGCAAALVPATSDPNQKMADGYALIENGRSIPAEKLFKEALEDWQKKKDEINTARAHSALGDLYRNGRTQGDFKLPNYEKARENYNNAIEIYQRNNMPKWAALNLWALSAVENAQGNMTEACNTLKKSKNVFLSAPDANKVTTPFEKAGAFTLQALEVDRKSYQCSSKR